MQFLSPISQKLALLMTRKVICASRVLHARKHAKLFIWIHDVSGIQAIRFGSWEWYNIDNLRFW